jgi:hypothetical protein
VHRRDFFRQFVSPLTGRFKETRDIAHGPELSENEIFMAAMEMGIDPATQSPGRLKHLVLEHRAASREASGKEPGTSGQGTNHAPSPKAIPL